MTASLSLLLIDDSEDESHLIVRHLRQAFTLVSRRVDTLEGLTSALAAQRWDVVLCDNNMPSFDSIEAIRAVKEWDVDIPVMVVTGTIGEERTAEIMKDGAHDCGTQGQLDPPHPRNRAGIGRIGSSPGTHSHLIGIARPRNSARGDRVQHSWSALSSRFEQGRHYFASLPQGRPGFRQNMRTRYRGNHRQSGPAAKRSER